MSWGAEGWLVIAAIVLTATIAMSPSLRLAERFRDQHFPLDADEISGAPTDPGQVRPA